jgi:hypothetical protein
LRIHGCRKCATSRPGKTCKCDLQLSNWAAEQSEQCEAQSRIHTTENRGSSIDYEHECSRRCGSTIW